MRKRLALLAISALAWGCGDDDGGGLDSYLPDIPDATGESQGVYAGVIDSSNASGELMPGSAASGMEGDFFIRNSRARFIVQGPGRVIGVIPQGGNLVDAQPIGPDGPIGEDHFGELSAVYVLGRTCEHDSVEVIRDGSDGGVAALRARGVSGNNDFVNLRGIGLLNVPADQDPTIDDGIECATTYILHPDSPVLDVHWTFYNAGDRHMRGPFGTLSDSGGEIHTWAHSQSFERLGIETLTGGDAPEAPTEYAVFQGPRVAYGLVPQAVEEGQTNTSFLIQGVNIVLYGADEIFDIITEEGIFFDLAQGDGVNYSMRFVVGHDAADVEEQVRLAREQEAFEVSGTVSWQSGDPIDGARVTLFRDNDSDGQVGPGDTAITYMDTAADGSYAGVVQSGDYLARADVLFQGRSTAAALALDADTGNLDLEVADPVYYDYIVVDDATDQPIPARLVIVGDNPAAPDTRVFPTYGGVSRADTILAMRGTSVDMGDGADERLVLPAGGQYLVTVSRGTEWSVATTVLSPTAGDPDGELEFRLRRVIDTTGYLSTEYHVHAIGSPDSPVDWPERLATAVVDGVELFAITEHDFVADIQPLVESMGLESLVRVIPGVETTPFAYGHFNAWPMQPEAGNPSGGAIDWARGAEGFALVPAEIFDLMRQAGAQLIQVNHPRAAPGALADFMEHFDRAGLTFDYDNRTISGDLLGQPVPNDWLRLPPDVSMFDMSFNAVEAWNSMAQADSNQDGRREPQGLDVVLRDWFNFLSFGFEPAALGNSDTHNTFSSPMGMPRTLVRVDDDSPTALSGGTVTASLLDTLTGTSERDLIVTNGPHIQVSQSGNPQSVIGRTLDVSGTGEVTLDISVQSPRWAHFDRIEVFVNSVPNVDSNVTALEPVACFTAGPVENLDAADPCALAPLGVAEFTRDTVEVATGFERYEALVSITLSDTGPLYPVGGTGEDAWVVVRVSGDRAVFPLLLSGTLGNVATLLSGDQTAIDAYLDGRGIPATAFTAPIFLDVDGGGYTAQFEPE